MNITNHDNIISNITILKSFHMQESKKPPVMYAKQHGIPVRKNSGGV